MDEFGVLTSRKRALIALIHSVAFLGIAIHGFVAPKQGILRGSGAVADFILVGIYLIVACILLWLVSLSRGIRESGYFLLCSGSAISGLLRTILGDPAVPPAQYLRVIFLSSAVLVGIVIVRSFAQTCITSATAAAGEVSPE